MEKKFKVTKKTVLKNVEPETFITNEQWVKDNKRFASFFVIEEIIEEKQKMIVDEVILPKKVKKEIVTETKQEIDNEEIS